MAVSVQQRGEKFQLRVTHRLLPRPFFHTFDTETEALARSVEHWIVTVGRSGRGVS